MKALVVRFSAIGDCVMAAWAATGIKSAYPDCQITWALQDTCQDVVDDTLLATERIVADRLAWRNQRWSPQLWRRQLALFSSLRRRKFDVGFDFQGHSKTALCLRLARPSRRFSHVATDRFAASLNPQFNVDRRSVHEVEAHFRLVRQGLEVGAPSKALMPQVPLFSPDRPVVIQTGASLSEKKYPAHLWREVAQLLVLRGLSVVAIGGSLDPSLDVPGVQDFVGKLTLRQALGVIRSASVHVGGDTGTGHAAAAYGVPTVSLFGRRSSPRFKPFGSPNITLQAESLADIESQKVVEAVLSQTVSLCVS